MGYVANPITGRQEAIIERGIVRLKAGEEKLLCMSLESIRCAVPLKPHTYIRLGESPTVAFFLNSETWPVIVGFDGVLTIERLDPCG